MESSILTTIKLMLGVKEEDTNFDDQIIQHINTSISKLEDTGVVNGLVVEDSTQTWEDLLSDISKYQLIKDYIFLDVKLIFDPPLNASVLQTYKDRYKEIEYRLYRQFNFPVT